MRSSYAFWSSAVTLGCSSPSPPLPDPAAISSSPPAAATSPSPSFCPASIASTASLAAISPTLPASAGIRSSPSSSSSGIVGPRPRRGMINLLYHGRLEHESTLARIEFVSADIDGSPRRACNAGGREPPHSRVVVPFVPIGARGLSFPLSAQFIVGLGAQYKPLSEPAKSVAYHWPAAFRLEEAASRSPKAARCSKLSIGLANSPRIVRRIHGPHGWRAPPWSGRAGSRGSGVRHHGVVIAAERRRRGAARQRRRRRQLLPEPTNACARRASDAADESPASSPLRKLAAERLGDNAASKSADAGTSYRTDEHLPENAVAAKLCNGGTPPAGAGRYRATKPTAAGDGTECGTGSEENHSAGSNDSERPA